MMKHSKTETLKQAYRKYERSTNFCLADCYCNCSNAKHKAYDYCIRKEIEYNGYNGKIIGFNSNFFSYGFIGEIDEKTAFFYITHTQDRFIYLDEI